MIPRPMDPPAMLSAPHIQGQYWWPDRDHQYVDRDDWFRVGCAGLVLQRHLR